MKSTFCSQCSALIPLMEHDNSCLCLGMRRARGGERSEWIDCFAPQQTTRGERWNSVLEAGGGKLAESLPQGGQCDLRKNHLALGVNWHFFIVFCEVRSEPWWRFGTDNDNKNQLLLIITSQLLSHLALQWLIWFCGLMTFMEWYIQGVLS